MKYYDGTLVSDDELHPLTTRNICLRTQARLTCQDPRLACRPLYLSDVQQSSVHALVVEVLWHCDLPERPATAVKS